MIFGGEKRRNEIISSTEIVTAEGQVTAGPEMPTPVSYHTISSINETTSIVTGGITYANPASPETWYFNHISQEFQPGPPLITGRERHISAYIQDHDTMEGIVAVVGGFNGGTDDVVLDSVELLKNGEWTQGK